MKQKNAHILALKTQARELLHEWKLAEEVISSYESSDIEPNENDMLQLKNAKAHSISIQEDLSAIHMELMRARGFAVSVDKNRA